MQVRDGGGETGQQNNFILCWTIEMKFAVFKGCESNTS